MEDVQYHEWMRKNSDLLDAMFSESIQDVVKKQDIELHFKLLKATYSSQLDRDPYQNSALSVTIGSYLEAMGWSYAFEKGCAELSADSKFDIVAKKGEKTIVIVVKSEISANDMVLMTDYLYSSRDKHNKIRFFIATDILNYYLLLDKGEIAEKMKDYAKKYYVGIIFATRDLAWVMPSEVINTHLSSN